ncbi:hypothetical protein [Amycolatopsis lurida]|uniref:hypothetical protein n=1 Tax=Amycolatopsis lurida TaxID=31959 RepID=UPI0036483740
MALTVAATVALVAPPATASTETWTPDRSRSVSLDAITSGLTDQKPQPPKAVGPVAAAQPDCSTVRANLAGYARSGARQVLCRDDAPIPEVGQRSGADGTLAAWCSGAAPRTVWVTRNAACVHGLLSNWSVVQVPNGAVLGTATFEISHEIDLFPTRVDVEDNTAVTLISSTGVLTSPTATLTATCSSPCGTSDGTGFTLETFTRGETEDAFFRYSGEAAINKAIFFSTSYTLTVQPPPGTTPLGPGTWRLSDNLFRCDDLVSSFRGCVIPMFVPEVPVSVSTHQAAAIGILVAQYNLPDGFGRTVPLNRLADENAAEANRRKICEDGTWVTRPDVRDDSCDEYAFARARQSGGFLGLTGKDCAEVMPWFNSDDGQWYYEAIRMTGKERCLRAHVPLDQNSLVGSTLGVVTNDARLIDGDPYWVVVYN